MAKRVKKIAFKRPYPEKAKDVPITASMLFGVRDELKEFVKQQIHAVRKEIHEVRSHGHEFKSNFHELKSEFQGFKSEIHGVKSEVHGLKSEIHEVKSEVQGFRSEIHEVKSEVHGLKSEIHRLAILMEEQNARNRIVMDGLTNLFTRQDRVEDRMTYFEKNFSRIK